MFLPTLKMVAKSTARIRKKWSKRERLIRVVGPVGGRVRWHLPCYGVTYIPGRYVGANEPHQKQTRIYKPILAECNRPKKIRLVPTSILEQQDAQSVHQLSEAESGRKAICQTLHLRSPA
jgi:hypothetical protein